MTGRLKNGILIAAVLALAIIPLIMVGQPHTGPEGKKTELFKGSDDQALAAIQALAPDYKPWFTSIYKTPSTEIESLLFALQAAIGAGFIGYYIGYARGRAKQQTPQMLASHESPELHTSGRLFCDKNAERTI
jgi:cobalt/nickel transport protein